MYTHAMDSAGVQTLTIALACVALVAGFLGVAVSGFVLARGTPFRVQEVARAALDGLQGLRGEWDAQRASVDAVLDSIHTERDNVRKSQNRLTAREAKGTVVQGPQSRDELLAPYRAGVQQ